MPLTLACFVAVTQLEAITGRRIVVRIGRILCLLTL